MRELTERIAAKAKSYKPSRAAGTLIALPFIAVGWLVGAVWFVAAWAWAAVVVGFTEAARKGR